MHSLCKEIYWKKKEKVSKNSKQQQTFRRLLGCLMTLRKERRVKKTPTHPSIHPGIAEKKKIACGSGKTNMEFMRKVKSKVISKFHD